MTTMEQTGMTAAPQRGVVGGFLARLAGFATDVCLLALFLVLGVACLNVLLAAIVLLWGVLAPTDALPVHRLYELDQAQMQGRSPREALAIFESDDYIHAYLRSKLGPAPTYDDIRQASFKYMYELDWRERQTLRVKVDALDLGKGVLAAVLAAVVYLFALRGRRYLLTRLIDASFESYVSKRYLVSRHAGSLVNLVTVVSVLGVSVGVMALVVVISVMDGFDNTLVNRMLGVFAHVEIWPRTLGDEYEFSESDYDAIRKAALAVDGVEAIAPVVRRQTFFQARSGINQERIGGMVLGLDPEQEQKVTRLTRPETIVTGSGIPGKFEVVLGSRLAEKLHVMPGDRVFALGKVITTARGATPKLSDLRVAGIFETGIYDVDVNFAYASLETVQNLSLADNRYSYLHLSAKDMDSVDRIVEELAETLPAGVRIRPWYDINKEFFEALALERKAMFIILLLIVVVAAFNIIGTLIMVVTQKTREIGILKSMGASNGMILRIFLYNGVLVGIVGTSLGTACGLWLCRFVENDIEKIFNMPGAVYTLDRLPVIVDPWTIGFLAVCALAICILASIIPAFRASRMNPVEALRYD